MYIIIIIVIIVIIIIIISISISSSSSNSSSSSSNISSITSKPYLTLDLNNFGIYGRGQLYKEMSWLYEPDTQDTCIRIQSYMLRLPKHVHTRLTGLRSYQYSCIIAHVINIYFLL